MDPIKLIPVFFLFFLLPSISQGLIGNKYEFDDGSTWFLLNNVTGYSYDDDAQSVIVDTRYVYYNYTKPSLSTSSSLVQARHGQLSTYNISLPGVCWSYDTDKLLLRGYSSNSNNQQGIDEGYSRIECYNGTDWQTIGTAQTAEPGKTAVSPECDTSLMYDGDFSTGCVYDNDIGDWVSCAAGVDNSDGCFKAFIYDVAMHWYKESSPVLKYITIPQGSSVLGANISLSGHRKTAISNTDLDANLVFGSHYRDNNPSDDKVCDAAQKFTMVGDTLKLVEFDVFSITEEGTSNEIHNSADATIVMVGDEVGTGNWGNCTITSSPKTSAESTTSNSCTFADALVLNNSQEYFFTVCWQSSNTTFLDDAYTNMYVNQDYASGALYKSNSSGGYYESSIFDLAFTLQNDKYSEDVAIQVNGTTIFNHTGNLTGINSSIDLNTGNVLEDCYAGSGTCTFSFYHTPVAQVNVFDLYLRYNKSNIAILDIVSPDQITAQVTSGNDYTVELQINNTGDWNATSFAFETVSAANTPNYNSLISFSCSNDTLLSGSSVLCNVTFSDLLQNPESDEKLKMSATGSDNDDTVYSDSIDVDITVVQPTTGGGSGGGDTGKCKWYVWRPANKVINLLGYPGYESNPQQFIILNNASNALTFTYQVQGIECALEESEQSIEGSSLQSNYVTCKYPPLDTKEEGIIKISANQCTSSINVKVSSSKAGQFFIYLSGAAGAAPWFLSWGGVVALLLVTGVVVSEVSR